MRQELEDQLVERYKSIFRDARQNKPDTTMKTSCMFWGLDVGDGWYNIIDFACRIIESHEKYSVSEIENYQHFVASQVKEKYGGLRFYYSGGDEFTNGVIQMAELMSEKTCELCGKPGAIKGCGWLACRCDECDESVNRRR